MKNDSGRKPWTYKLETGEILIIVCIFAAAQHVVMTLIALVLFVLSAWNDRRKSSSSVPKDKPVAVAMIDVSGSFRPVMARAIEQQLCRFAEGFTVHVVLFDTRVCTSYSFQGKLEGLHLGGGGSEINAALEAAVGYQPSLLLVFSDEFVSVPPGTGPGVPALWFMMDGGRCPAEWATKVPEWAWA